jgi:hypothetical protein
VPVPGRGKQRDSGRGGAGFTASGGMRGRALFGFEQAVPRLSQRVERVDFMGVRVAFADTARNHSLFTDSSAVQRSFRAEGSMRALP